MAENSFSLRGNTIVLKPFLVADINYLDIVWLNNKNVLKLINQP
jgi:hypothetical protein